ncbi:hypothetical protein [Bosea sp. 117]|uniref:hypothetical protein n=1 Tax=Bosea sp. 117 TaxID=1125973 RepID=UPI000494972F|nr:hypothetical protein [Bosea sp. 117]
MISKLETLHSRLLLLQRELLAAAAEVNTGPSDKALQKIANLEIAIGAVESMIDDETKVHAGSHDTGQ